VHRGWHCSKVVPVIITAAQQVAITSAHAVIMQWSGFATILLHFVELPSHIIISYTFTMGPDVGLRASLHTAPC